MSPRKISAAAAFFALTAASAFARPSSIVAISGMGPADISSDGTVILANGVSLCGATQAGFAARVTLGSPTVVTNIGGNLVVKGSGTATAAAGIVPNTTGVGSQPTDAMIGAFWTQSSGAWTNNGAFTTPGNCSGTVNSPTGMSANGRYVVGGGWIGDCGTYRAYLFDTQTKAITNLSSLGGPSQSTHASGVSSSANYIVGFDSNATTGVRIPALWKKSGNSYTEIILSHAAAADQGGEVFAINDAGNVAVGTSFEFVDGNYRPHLVRWTTTNGWTTWTATSLGMPTDQPQWMIDSGASPDLIFDTLAPSGLSEDGNTIIGTVTYREFSWRVSGAFIWKTTTTGAGGVSGPKDLRDYLAALPSPPSGLNAFTPDAFSTATAISTDGNSIIGTSFSPPNPAYLIRLASSACFAPAVTMSPCNVAISNCGTDANPVFNAGFIGTVDASTTTQWYRVVPGGTDIPLVDGPDASGSTIYGAASQRLYVADATPAFAGSYYCKMTNACGTARTANSVVTVAPAVANDTCGTATPIGEVSGRAFSVCGAYTTDGSASCSANGSNADVWFAYTPTFTGDARISTCGSTFASVVSIYSSCGGPELACSTGQGVASLCGNSGNGLIDRVHVTAGHVYRIRVAVDGPYAPFEGAGLLTVSVAPGPVANDNCSSPAVAALGSTAFNSTEATTDGSADCNPSSGRDVWFSFTPAAPGQYRISTCGAEWDSVLSISATCSSGAIACNDDVGYGVNACYNLASRIDRVTLAAGTTYRIRVAGVNASTGGPGSLVIAVAPPLPANDNCVTASAASPGANPFDLTEATTELSIGCPSDPIGAATSTNDVWFSFVPSCTGVYTIETCGSAIWDPMLHLFHTCGGADFASSDNVGETDGCGYAQARISGITLAGGTPVLIRVASSGDYRQDPASGILTITRTGDPACKADFNGVSGVSVQDIFDFLAAWFAGCH